MATTHGHCDPAFSQLRELFQQRLSQGHELCASLCVNIDGKNVVDLWGGYADAAHTKPWNEDTITVVWSVTKVVSSLAANILIDRGLLDPNEKVSKYWPEFAANGKDGVLVAHILTHSSGVASWDPPIAVEDIYNLKKSTDALAQQAPWWKPGEVSGYHMVNYGHLIGELVQRTSGKSLAQFIAEEIARPLGADFRLGVPEVDWPRAADIIPPPPVTLDGLDPQSVEGKTFAGGLVPAERSMSTGFRKASIGAINGFSNARALARIGSMVSQGGSVDGKRYLSPEAVDQILQEKISGKDLVLLSHFRFGLGVGLPVPSTLPWIPQGRIGFWFGWGGSILIMDRDRRMTIGYVMNKMGTGPLVNENTEAYVRAIYEIVDAMRL
ncbi:hypothetical protein MPDQ_001588 [Monascus purpureus]|uniref:Beta-lactamase-related domain-containing protein n=1 Tax=Monascus purpureus TaxID=5098 RepID=A0A507QRM1_MONPU|nr:hypothetical protein MPDQ_001588 [Monascus purpureus]BDD62638.1 hypothetical protein MAP00_007600 [Monascus purpureus]